MIGQPAVSQGNRTEPLSSSAWMVPPLSELTTLRVSNVL